MKPDNWIEIQHTIGVLVPATNSAVEAELNRILPPQFQIYAARLQVGSVDAQGWAQQDADIDYQSRLLGTLNPELIILLQTSASFFTEGYDETVTARIQAASDTKAVTTAQVMVDALRALQARRVALVSPYSPTVSENARAYLHSGHGFDVTAVEGLNITDPGTITGLDAGPITSALARAAISKPDVFIVAGGAFHGMRYIDAWEEQFGRPVITTNQLAIWATLRAVAETVRIDGYGRLLAQGA